MVTYAQDYFIQEGVEHPWIDLKELQDAMPNLKTIRMFQRGSSSRYMWSYGPVLPSIPIRRTVFLDSELDTELLEDLEIDSHQHGDLVESSEIEITTDGDENTNPLRKFWTHEEILEVDSFFRHSDEAGEEPQGMLTW